MNNTYAKNTAKELLFMKEFFDVVKNKLLDELKGQGFTLQSESTGGNHMIAVIANEEERLNLEYDKKLFSLYRGPADGAESSMLKVQTYLFDSEAGDGVREATGVANEFIETLGRKAGTGIKQTQPQQRKRNKDKNSEENDVIFFINRLITSLPECRTPLQQHKAHYEQLLPRRFCEEVVTAAQRDMMREGNRARIAEYFQLLETMYTKGDLDVRAIIMQILLAAVSEKDYPVVESYFSDDNRKAWIAARKFYGKNVRPEAKSTMQKFAAYQADTLNSKR